MRLFSVKIVVVQALVPQYLFPRIEFHDCLYWKFGYLCEIINIEIR